MTLDDLAALEKGATSAPWGFNDQGGYVCFLECDPHSGRPTTYVSAPRSPGLHKSAPDAAFIAAMRNHAKALIEIASYAKSLLSEDGAFEAISHFNVAFGLKEALAKLEAEK